jgi:hypothetical protein
MFMYLYYFVMFCTQWHRLAEMDAWSKVYMNRNINTNSVRIKLFSLHNMYKLIQVIEFLLQTFWKSH